MARRAAATRNIEAKAILLALAGTGHLLYPAFVRLAGRRDRTPQRPVQPSAPAVSVVIPAYRESRVIGPKVESLRTNGYPGQLEIVVVPEDEDTAAAARATDATVVPFRERTGKAGALARGAEAASHPILVFTDANAVISPNDLERLVAWLEDPKVGAVGAQKRVEGENLYWAFEDRLKRAEMRLGTSVALDGAIVAVRRDEFVPIPENVVVDDLWLAIDAVERGQSIVYDPEVLCREEGFPVLRNDWERRTRIVAGTLDVLWRRRQALRRTSTASLQLWGHRVVRSSIGPASHLILFALCATGRGRADRVFVTLNVAAAALAVSGRVRRAPSRPERLAYQVLYLQAVGLGGTLRFLRGDRPSRWKKDDRAPLEPSSA